MVWLISRSTSPKSRASKRRSIRAPGFHLVHYKKLLLSTLLGI